MTKINGIDNEYEFVKYLNDRKIYELNPMFRGLIDYLYPNVNENSIIKSWRNHISQKTDVFIRVNGIMKGISIKKGSRNSVRIDRISDFIKFLLDNNVSKDIVNNYLLYHFADGTINGKGIKRLSIEQYKEKHKKEIKLINDIFKQENILKNAIDRFILKGNNSEYYIDAIVYGECWDFLWLKKEDIYKIILKKKNIESTAVHFGSLTVQPKTRCLNYNSKYEKDRFCVQIKWYSLFDDIIECLNDNVGSNSSMKKQTN